ncbi:ATP-binding protein [Candidatus Saccharibacteria bacterium]|nr:ATP-binding protein [Candidatus Saccharibacteria bacterium]
MKVNLRKAMNKFFSNPAFEMIYSEAMANALDANATRLRIDIYLESFDKPETLSIKIQDNGNGFSEENFLRFSSLMNTKDSNHKGLGRLVYLKYFSTIKFESIFQKDQSFTKRSFIFNEKFDGEKNDEQLDVETQTGATLQFNSFCNEQLKTYDNVVPEAIKTYLKNCFLPRLYTIKQNQSNFELIISLNTQKENPDKKFVNSECSFSLEELPALQEKVLNNQELDLFQSEFKLMYYIDNSYNAEMKNVTAICIDDRAIELNLLEDQKIPESHKFIFLLQSEYLNEKSDDARQNINLKDDELETLKRIFFEQIGEIISGSVPAIKERNVETRKNLSIKYPHLEGLFPENSIGLLDEHKSVEIAQNKFFKEQKEILSADNLSDEQYDKSLIQASRVLAEYILYRNKIIQKLKTIESDDKEKKIHDLIIPMRKSYSADERFDDRFINNAWLLDDKFMSYRTILSDENIEKLINEITEDNEAPSDLRPDIAFVFSDDINTCDHPVDVVVVELKKKDLGYLDNRIVIEQMKQRARRLLAYYPSKIQRMWFFGVVEIDPEMRLSLEEEWIPLYSKGEVFYKEEALFPMNKNKERIGNSKIPVSMTILSFDALWADAESRNDMFLDILKKSIEKHTKENNK